ncbi:MAG: PEP-CTERM sorting domain-containing protein [Rhodospirillales bacterium]
MRIAILGVSLCIAIPVAQATMIDINSGPGIGSNNISGENVAVEVHPMWQPNGDAVWISYRGDTGGRDPGFVVPDVLGSMNPADLAGLTPSAIFFHPFTLPSANNTGAVTVWADDTARVLLNGVEQFPANGRQSATCAGPDPIGCSPARGQTISLNGLPAGQHTLAIEAFQRNGGPFGVMYQGSVDSRDPAGPPRNPGPPSSPGPVTPPTSSATHAPEPGTYVLLGGGLIALLGLARQRLRKA